MSKRTLPEAVSDGGGGGEEVVWHESRPTFTQLPAWLLAHPEVSDAALRTWLVLASFADRQGEAFPGVARIASDRGKSRRQIFEHLDNLERAGAIRRHARYRPKGGGRTSTLYVLAWAYPLAPDPQKSTPESMGAENRTHGMGAENLMAPREENRTPRTKTTNEVKPLTPPVDNSGVFPSKSERGGGPPRTPTQRSSQKQNPRALGTNPRALAKKAQEAQERAERIENARTRGYRQARLTNPPMYESVEEYRESLDAEARRHLRELDPELLEAELGGYAAGLASRATASSER